MAKTEEEIEREGARPAFWRDIRFLRFTGQAVFVVAVLVAIRALAGTLTGNLEQQGRELDFEFLQTRAGFEISEGIDYSPNESLLKAIVVGLVNTLRIAGSGIILTTILGVTMGVARLSPNWMLRNIARLYVDIIRNTPVLIQIYFWFAVFLSFPTPEEGGISAGPFALFTVRALNVVWPRFGEGAGVFWLTVLAGVVVAYLVGRWRTRRWEETGEPHRRVLIGIGIALGFAAIGHVLGGGVVTFQTPEVEGFGVEGGVQLTPALAAVLVALVVYTSSFVAEIVRGSILAVQKGQKEAGKALGLSSFQELRYVVLPQAMRIAIPPINSQYLNLTKNSSLALAVGYPDVTGVIRTILNQEGHEFEMLLTLMATYLILSLTISTVMNLINRRVTRKGART